MAQGKDRWAHKWKLILAAAAAVLVCIVLYRPLTGLVLALRLAKGLQGVSTGATSQDLSIKEMKISRNMGGRVLEAMVYQSSNVLPAKAIMLVAGISELGCYHPKLVAVSRLMAGNGFLVITPDISEYREFKISPEPLDQISFWTRQIKTLEVGRDVQKVGLAGISFSGTLALIAATRPEIRNSVDFVLALGPYYDLHQCTRGWFGAGPITVGGGYYPTRYYAKWIMMLAAMELLTSDRDRQPLRTVLNELLLHGKASTDFSAMSTEGRRWYRLATMREDQSDPELATEIEGYLTSHLYQQLDPAQAAVSVHCPVFIMHGEYDDLISPQESRVLHEKIVQSYLLITPFLTHTHPLKKPLSYARRASAAIEGLLFFYRIARVVG
jgi:pimeloyl-ACP methyl ester carboxylesterase